MSELTIRLRVHYNHTAYEIAEEAADRIDALEECLRESVYCLEHDVTVERSINLLDKARALLEGK